MGEQINIRKPDGTYIFLYNSCGIPEEEKINAYMPDEDANEVFRLRKLEKSILCKLSIHSWNKDKDGIRFCKKCGKVDLYFGFTGRMRWMKEKTF